MGLFFIMCCGNGMGWRKRLVCGDVGDVYDDGTRMGISG